MLGIRLKNLLLGKEQKGLWDIFTEEKQNTHLKAFDELLEAQKNQGKKFNFNDWVKGYKTLDEVALKYFKDVKVGAATQDDFINAMNKTKVTVKATGSRMENFTNGVRGFFTSLKSVTAAIGKTLAGFAANAAFYAAIAGLIKVADLAVKTAKEKTDQAVSSAQDYEKARSNVEALEGQLESIGSQIDTLQAKGHLSFTDQTELANLKTKSAELEKQLGLQQELADIKQDKAARDASEAFDAYSQQNAIDTNGEGFWTNILDSIERFAAKVNDAVGSGFAPTGGSIGLLRGHKSGTPDQILLDRIKAAKAAKKELESLQDSQTADNYDEVQKQIKEQEKVVNNYYSDLEKLYSEASQYTSSFFDPETGEALAGYEEEAKRWETVQDSYLDFFGKNKEKSKESLLNTLFSKAEFLNLEEALVDAGKQGEQAVSDLIDKTPGLTDALDEAGISADELKNHIMSIADPDAYNIKEISEQLSEAFADTDDDRLSQFEKFLSNKNPEDIEIFYKYINDGDIDLSDLTMQDVQELFLKVTADTSAADVSLEELSQKATGVVSSVESALSMLSSQSTGTSISPDLFSNDQLKDYASALEYVNGCYKLNEEAVKELTQAKVKEQIATNDAKKSLEQQEYLKNAAQIDALRHKLEQNTLASGESKESIQAQIDSLLESNSAIVSNCQQLDVLNASLRESVGLYQQWINEQNASNSGDMFDDAATAWSQLREVADSESDMYGRVGTKQYQASVDFIIPETVDHSDQEAVQNYLDGIKKYMYFDDEGNVNGLNMEQFFSDAVDKGLMVETEDSYEMAGQMTMEKFAEGMNMSLPLVQAIFGEIDEFRPEGEEWFSWADEAVQSLGDLAVVASDSADALQATEQFKDLDIQLDISGLDSKEEKLNSLDATIEQMNGIKATPGIDTSSIEHANNIIQYCVQQKQALNEPAVMSVDTSLLEGKVGDAVALLQQFHQAQNELEMQKALQLDTSEAESKVAGLTSQIQGLDPKITAALGIDPSSTETIASTLEGLTPELMVEAGVDEKAVIGYKPDDKKATVKFGVDHSAVDRYSPPDFSRTVTYSIVTQGSYPAPPKKGKHTVNVNGNAHAYGTALANGVWGAKQGGMSLVGELGPEIIVDPQTGRWHTVGDNGAEFTYVPKHALVFNHIQSDALLKNGFVSSRAQSFASGTAFASGNAFVTGGIPKKHVNNKNKNQSSSESKSSAKAAQSSAQAAKSSAQAAKSSADAADKASNLVDWIERMTSAIEHNTKALQDRIDDFELYRNQNKQIDAYVASAQNQIEVMRNAQNKYMTKANALGVPGNYVHKIWTGELDIEDIQDENLREKVSQYQEWYDAARNLGDQIHEVNRQIRETKIQKLENIQDDYDNLNAYHESLISINDAVSELSETQNLVGSQSALWNNLDQQKQIKAYYQASVREMQAQLDALVADGTIGLHSDTWLKWTSQINEAKKAIIECDSAVEKLKASIMEIRLDSFNKMLETLEHSTDMASSLRDLMSSEGIFDDDIKITDNGYAQLALLSEELVNSKQSVANYNKAIEALNQDLKVGNVTQAQYNKKLQEYEKAQMDAVKAVQSARDAILDIVKDGINKETEAMEELISKRKDDLSAQKEYYDFQKKMMNQSKEMNKLRAQLAALEGDDSLEAQQKRRKLNSQLQEMQDQYDEDQKDHEYDVVQDAYDETLDKFKENQEEILHDLETNLDAQNQAIQNYLSSLTDNYQLAFDQLKQYADAYGINLSTSLTQPWQNAQNALNQYLQAVGKVDPNINIDTGKIESNYNPVDTSNKVGNEANQMSPSKTGQWIQQDGNWWYQHNDGSYSVDRWEQIDGTWYKFDRQGWMQTGWQPWGKDSKGREIWYYLQPSGAMATSQWITGKDGKQYYVDKTGAMVRESYVKAQSGGLYYWVNAEGVWEPQWNTYNPDLSKYKLAYAKGSRSTMKGLGKYDESGLGSEFIISKQGILREFKAGEMVFNSKQKNALYNFSADPTSFLKNLVMTPNIDQAPKIVQPIININESFNIDKVDNSTLPNMKQLLEDQTKYMIQKLRGEMKKLK